MLSLTTPTGQAHLRIRVTKITYRPDWLNIVFLSTVHLLALYGLYYMVFDDRFSWWSLALGVLWFALCGLSITGGYHRLFSHPTYKARKPLELFYLLFGAASVQNSALKWSADHRRHHAKVDKDEDPYNIVRGFWWAHIGWVLRIASNRGIRGVPDLAANPLIQFQHRFYVPLAILFSSIIPFCLGFLWGDPLGALLIAGFVRLAFQYHATFAVNSVAHYIGKRPYTTSNTARDSWITAIVTLGEGYHNFHHRFQIDYRNGVRFYQLDPTKWFVWTMSKIGVTWDLKRTSKAQIDAAKRQRLAHG